MITVYVLKEKSGAVLTNYSVDAPSFRSVFYISKLKLIKSLTHKSKYLLIGDVDKEVLNIELSIRF